MSSLHHESLLETCYEEAWVDFAKTNNLTFDQLDALDQNSELGYLPVIALMHKEDLRSCADE